MTSAVPQWSEYDALAPLKVRMATLVDRHGALSPRRVEIYNRVCAKLDEDAVARVIAKYRGMIERDGYVAYWKYFDTAWWIWHKTSYAERFDLDRRAPISILDIGVGAGHFAFIAQALGHKVIGIDLADPAFDEMCAMLGVDKRVVAVERGQPLPPLGLFDIVPAIWLMFDALDVDEPGNGRWWKKDVKPTDRIRYWDVSDWRFFFTDLRRQLYPGATVFLELNPHYQADGSLGFDESFVELCVSNGAILEKGENGTSRCLTFRNADQLEFSTAGRVGRAKDLPEDHNDTPR